MVFNSVMVYLLATVAHYKQLSRISQPLLEALEGEIARLAGSYDYLRSSEREGKSLFQLGSEHGLDPWRAVEFAFALYQALAARREELYGFNLLMAVEQGEGGGLAVVQRLERLLMSVEEDEELWFDPGSWALVSGFLDGEQAGTLTRVPRKVLPEQAREARGQLWKQGRLPRTIARAVLSQARSAEPVRVLFLHGQSSVERRLVLDAVQQRLFAGSSLPGGPRVYPLSSRRSAIHPFLNSVDPFLLDKVPQYLGAAETAVWWDTGGLLRSLKPGPGAAPAGAAPADATPGLLYRWPRGVPDSVRRRERSAGAPAAEAGEPGEPGQPGQPGTEETLRALGGFTPEQLGGVCPDRLGKDFLLAYELYLSACFRMMDEHLLPALWICEDVDTYVEATLESVALVIRDFGNSPSFVPVLASSADKPPEALRGLPVHSIPMRVLSLKESAGLARRLYPGLRLPPAELKELRRHARGRALALTHLLRSLERDGVIARGEERFEWSRGEGFDPLVRKGPLTLAWHNASALPFASQRLLYIVYLQSGLLDLWGLVSFLKEQQMGETDIFGFLDLLAEQGLVHVSNHVVPLFPQFRKRLRRRVLEQEEDLEERFVDYLVGLWRAGRYPHRVLLYFLLSKTGRAAAALEVLAALLKQKLDELDFAGVRLFLDPKHVRLGASLDPEARKDLGMLLTAVRLRLCLLTGDRRQAEALYLKAMDSGGDYQVRPVKGELFRQTSAYLLGRGEAGMSLQWIKKAVLQFQGSDDSAGERAATADLGGVLLAEGKFEEALEYFAIAEQSPTRSLQVEDVSCKALQGVALLLLGNLSRAQSEVDRGLARARFLKSREWQLFLEFLRSRLLFEFGFYPEAIEGFQHALATEALYDFPAARQVLYGWLGRCHAYLGSTDTALGVLEQGEESWERHLFLAEARMFREEYLRALDHCDRALARNKVLDAFPGVRPGWADGFWDVECRCLVLLRENSMSRRLIQSLQAYLWSLEGSGERGIEQLYSITRGERLPDADPYQSLYNFYYAASLPDVRKDELDDSLTVLNRALKLLQQRASRIEDSTLRWRYLNNNYWNARLFAEAKRRKLL
ncbi:MAG: hypothetical protein JW820_14975 [Spirochaetales bacterium]|nr:hypothetical protein [Spirochaetales bacterium]